MSLSRLSHTTGISISQLNRIENEESNPTLPAAYAIANALKVSVYEVFPDERRR